MNSTFERIKKIQEILDEKAYLQSSEKQPFWRRLVHFWVLVAKSFQRNRGPVRAAALAYTTVLSLIPVLAVVVSISTGFLQNDKGNTVRRLLDHFVAYVAPQLNLIQADKDSEAMDREAVVDKIQSYIETVNSGTLGLTAGLALVFIAVMVLSTVEATFNDIWGVNRGRTWSARVIQYWAAITLGPIFIVTAMALTSVATTEQKPVLQGTNNVALFTNITVSNISVPAVSGSLLEVAETPTTNAAVSTNILAIIKRPAKVGFWKKLQNDLAGSVVGPLLSFVVLSVFLTLLYRLMPATKVKWEAAAVGGLVGGGLLQLNNLLSVIYLSRVVQYSKIYGSIGAVPIFLLGLYFSWMIVLLGAQVAYAYQNRQAYLQEKQAESINQRGREFVALRVMTYIAQKFYLGEKPTTRLVMSNALGVPSQLTCQVLNALVTAKLLVEVAGDETGYTPGRPVDKITVEDILASLRVGVGSELATADDPSRAVVREQYDKVVLAEMHAAGAVTLQNLVMRVASLPQAVENDTRTDSPTVAVA
ncbi:MAG: YhjD/YihY/BrkB family envelope integrity protein [Limisphaerales bacterium]